MDTIDRHLLGLDVIAVSRELSFPWFFSAGEAVVQTLSLMEQLRGEALKFHKPGEQAD